MECIVQSHASCIDILPALPDEWQSGSLSGVRLRSILSDDNMDKKSPLTADIKWADGKLAGLCGSGR